jgi:ubiquinol-cytochrome c reductase cytochrome c subunit
MAALFLPALAGALAVLLFPARHSAADPGFDPRITWLGDCATCHAADGSGTQFGPTLQHTTGTLLEYELSTGRMPLPYGDHVPHRATPKYTAPQIDQLASYVLSITHAPTGALPPVVTDLAHANSANGGEVFRLNCSACHTVTGVGGALLHRDAPPLGPATPQQTAAAVREGPGAMPAFGTAAISDTDLRDVVAYVHYLHRPNDAGGWAIGHVGPITEGLVGFVVGTLGLLVVARMIGTRT